jgi:hypothetical protein
MKSKPEIPVKLMDESVNLLVRKKSTYGSPKTSNIFSINESLYGVRNRNEILKEKDDLSNMTDLSYDLKPTQRLSATKEIENFKNHWDSSGDVHNNKNNNLSAYLYFRPSKMPIKSRSQ